MTNKANNLIYGIHAVKSILEHDTASITKLYVSKNREDQTLRDILDSVKIPVQKLSRQELDKLVDGAKHQGVIAVCRPDKKLTEMDLDNLLDQLDKPPFLLILDGVQDPHNLGACLRTANAAGVDAVIAPKDNAVGLTATVKKSACGAASSTPFFQVTNLSRTMRNLQQRGIWFYGAEADARESLYADVDLTGAIAIVLGSEGKGLRQLTKKNCDKLIRVPMYGMVSSLNVSVTAGIVLFEVLRQRSCQNK